jgi:hypothetical protein
VEACASRGHCITAGDSCDHSWITDDGARVPDFVAIAEWLSEIGRSKAIRLIWSVESSLADHFRWHATDNGVRRNIVDDHRACSYNGTFANGHAIANR